MSRRLLILTDLHLGRDCKEITGFKTERPNPEFDLALISLIDLYTAGKEVEWKIILGGDFIDFIEVVVVPEAEGFLELNLSFEVTDEEKEFGLGSEPERALVKLDKTITYHRAVFQRLAAFVKAGGELVLVRGNHDVELFWPKVQRVLRRMFADLAFQRDGLEVDEAIELRNQFQSRILIAPWFYYEKGRIYFEHGNQYDAYCSFDNWLHPVSPDNANRIDTPISLFAMRYFANMMSDYSPYQVSVWTWRDYATWLRAKGLGGALYTLRMAAGAAIRALDYGARWTFGSVGHYAREHHKRIAEESERYGIPAGTLRAIDGLHHTPVSRNLPELMRLMFVDRLLLGIGASFLAALMLIVIDALWLELVGLALVLILGYRVNRVMEPRRYLLPGPKQAEAARRIAELLDVQTVVMGHSHARASIALGPGRHYINVGCWLPALPGRAHTDAKLPCTCKLSHVVVEPSHPAELRVFCYATRKVRLADLEEQRPEATDDRPTEPVATTAEA